jgi:hypothetical protein
MGDTKSVFHHITQHRKDTPIVTSVIDIPAITTPTVHTLNETSMIIIPDVNEPEFRVGTTKAIETLVTLCVIEMNTAIITTKIIGTQTITPRMIEIITTKAIETLVTLGVIEINNTAIMATPKIISTQFITLGMIEINTAIITTKIEILIVIVTANMIETHDAIIIRTTSTHHPILNDLQHVSNASNEKVSPEI